MTVKPLNTTATIKAVSGTSIFPGDIVQLYLELKNQKGRIDGSADWSWSGDKLTPQSGGEKQTDDCYHVEQDNVYQNDQPILVTLNATKDNDSTGTTEVTVNYKASDGTEGAATVDITVTTLTMVLKYERSTLYYSEQDTEKNSEKITAQLYDASTDEDVTEKYDIEWSLNPTDDAYGITGSGNTATLTINSNPERSKEVTLTAIAKTKGADSVVCSASKTININNKKTVVKTYSCAANTSKELEFTEDDNEEIVTNIHINSITASYLTSTGSTGSCGIDSIPTLTLSKKDDKLSITMNPDASKFGNYKHILISVDTETVLYNFYIIPVQNNVYDKNKNLISYVPGELETIKKMGTLISSDNKKGEYYTYEIRDTEGVMCYLRLSIHKRTGIGTFNNWLYSNSSIGKWFMKRDSCYYEYTNGRWYMDSGGIYTEKISNYWSLDERILLLDGWTSNKTFWQKWK